MTTLAIVLKDEIRRLARKEIKAQTSKQARAVAQYRREIARLKRQHRDLEKQLAYLSTNARLRNLPSKPKLNQATNVVFPHAPCAPNAAALACRQPTTPNLSACRR